MSVQESANQADPQAVEEVTFHHLDAAIREKNASFYQLFETMHWRKPDVNKNPEERRAYERYYPDVLKSFQECHGAVVKLYAPRSVPAAAVLTKHDKIFTTYPLAEGEFDSFEIQDLLFESEYLSLEALRLLDGKDRTVCSEKLFSVICFLLELLNVQAKGSDEARRRELLRVIVKELNRVRDYYANCVQRRAQVSYFYGMVWGILFFVLAACIITITHLLNAAPEILRMSAPGYLAGGIGAVVSVMQRMTFGNLFLKPESGRSALMWLGAFRPVIGAIFGLLVVFSVQANLLPVSIPSDASKHIYFFSTLAFLAGFSERWAQDMLAVTEKGLYAGRKREATERKQKLRAEESDQLSKLKQIQQREVKPDEKK